MVESNALIAQFAFGSPAKLDLGGKHLNRKFSTDLNASACSFSTGGSVKSFRSKGRSVRLGPFASISMSLPFAAATVSKAPVKESPAIKKKKSFAEIFDYASKKALSGGLPGMVAMGLQVLSLMWLR